MEAVIFMITIFRFLEDGAWHSLKQIASKSGVPIEELSDYCITLSKHQVLEYDAHLRRVKIGPELIGMRAALKKHDWTTGKWQRMGAGTVIVPPLKGLQIQGISLQNMTELDLKIEFTFKAKPIEIVISTV
jgi:hypothetical protein